MVTNHHLYLSQNEKKKCNEYVSEFLMLNPVVNPGFKTLVTADENLKPTLLHYFKKIKELCIVIRLEIRRKNFNQQ